MKKYIRHFVVFIGLFTIINYFNSCGQNGSHQTIGVKVQNSSHQMAGVSSYDALYKDSFEVLLHSETPPYSQSDTIYTEMYIALKAMKNDKTNQCAKMVCEKVDQLMIIDTIKINQIHYLEAKQIALGILKDKEGFIKSAFQQFNLYPENSVERLSSLGSLFLATNQNDSANYYLNRCLQVSKENLSSSDSANVEKGVMGVFHSLVLLNKDQEAKSFIKKQFDNNPSEDLKKLLHSLDEDYEKYKGEEWKSVETLFGNF